MEMQPGREAQDKKTTAQEILLGTMQSEANITTSHIDGDMDGKIEKDTAKRESEGTLRPVQMLESEPFLHTTNAENDHTPEEQNEASDEDTAKPLQKPSLIVTLSCPEIARFVTEDTDSDEELAEQDMYGGEDGDDEGPEPLSEVQLAYFYAHFVDMDWDLEVDA
ncbi:hypothetical protein J4E89_009336 [Alternaria sp. Ai002NY15]|nr:hypothetical protein J4E89_009336 [Alternaria sp. Ai002NY15]